MDPLSASLGARLLFRQLQKTIEQFRNLKNAPSTLSDIQGDLEQLKTHLYVLEEATALLEKSSTAYPQSVKAAFADCVTKTEILSESLRKVNELFDDDNNSHSKNKQRPLSQPQAIPEAAEANITASTHPELSHDFAKLVYKFVDDISKYGKIDLPIPAPRPGPPSNIGANVVGLVTGLWNITFSAGLQGGTPRWGACRAKPDTGCNGNWVKQSILERSGLLDSIRPFSGDPLVLVDASDHLHPVTHTISLTWYRNEEATSRTTEFFVIDSGPYEMMFGEEFILENLERLFPGHFTREGLLELGMGPGLAGTEGAILPGLMRPMTKAERKQLEQDKRSYRQRNLDIVAREDEAKAKLAEAEPVPAIAGVGKDTDSGVSELSRDAASADGTRFSLEGLSLDPSTSASASTHSQTQLKPPEQL
ncbi:hypothetical protein DL98DRAFT_616939 [Cadophora sp. DSE1049]|nr:hypothetical protein DL98DRAFT_616939 [Cadophora sp. DSE1049]